MVTNLSDDTKINRKDKNEEENTDLRNYVNTVVTCQYTWPWGC